MSDTYRSDPKRAAELAVILAQHAMRHGHEPAPGKVAMTVADMQKAARTAKRAAEHACNEPMTDDDRARVARRLSRAQDKIAAQLAELTGGVLTCHVDLSGDDARGPCARLHIPGQRGDGWGDGFAVY